jgi:gamma-glutamyl-gamma-aminobutyrate hydrolase PuuD
MRDTLICMLGLDTAEVAFQNIFSKITNAFHEEHYANVDSTKTVFLFRGGQDIHPSLYGEKRIPENGSDILVSNRDAFEFKAFHFAKKMGIPMLGICRGSQFLCAMSGGKLVQHVEGHACGEHPILAIDGKKYQATSTHHQMMFPWTVKHTLIAWATPKRSHSYILNPKDIREEIIAEPEIGIQGHPEYLTQSNPFTKYCNNLVKDYLL